MPGFEPPEIELAVEEQLERDILAQTDAKELTLRDAQGIGNIIWTAVESAALGKRVTSIPQYVEILEADGSLVGRSEQGREKVVTDAGVSVEVSELVIVGTRRRGE